MDLSKLKEPFSPEDIEWRINKSGIKNGKPWAQVLAYIQSRAIMDRLDEVCGPENWKNEYTPAPCGGVICKISIRIDGEWLTKEDGAENTNIEAVKGGISGALKRAGVPWGIGRYLYKLDSGWAVFAENGAYSSEIKEGNDKKWFSWNPPELPKWALPNGAHISASGACTEKPKPPYTQGDKSRQGEATATKNDNSERGANWYKDSATKECKTEEELTAWWRDNAASIKALGGKYEAEVIAHCAELKKSFAKPKTWTCPRGGEKAEVDCAECSAKDDCEVFKNKGVAK